MRHRIRRATMGKDAVKHSGTILLNTGSGATVIPSFTIARVNVGDRIASGTTTNLQENITTGNVVQVGDIIKYVNLCFEVGSRNEGGGATMAEDNGWLEYGVVKVKEANIPPSTTNIGTKMLADILTTNYRGDVLFTGCIPVGASQPNSLDLKLKMPRVWQKMQWGSKLLLFFYFRSVLSTDVRTDSTRVIISSLFKSYS